VKKVLVFGTFDLLHPGHLSFLRQAKRKGSRLIASIARDEYVRERKHREPCRHDYERLTRVLETGLVDEAYLSDEELGSFAIVERCRPDVVCFGHDQDLLRKHLLEWIATRGESIGCRPATFTLEAHHPERYKSSKIRRP
jgi:FAD synthetase